ncbi:MAG TPA: DUF4163 domain-containing protein [Bacteroidetes bacterium]|nr:DUF4163 domain-containing protein [Bacteroidota bacterium]
MRPLAILLVLGLVGCSTADAPAGPSTPPPAPETAMPSTVAERPSVTPTTVETDSITVDDPARRLVVDIAVPVVSSAYAGTDRVNERLYETANAGWTEMAPLEPLAADASEWERYEFSGGYEVELADGPLVSVVLALYAYTGGAHGNTSFAPQTFDLETGRALGLEDMIQTTPAALGALRDAVESALVTEMASRYGDTEAQAREMLWLGDLTASTETFDGRMTLGADSLQVHFAPYAVAPYAAGTFRIPVAYADLDGHLGPVAARLTDR